MKKILFILSISALSFFSCDNAGDLLIPKEFKANLNGNAWEAEKDSMSIIGTIVPGDNHDIIIIYGINASTSINRDLGIVLYTNSDDMVGVYSLDNNPEGEMNFIGIIDYELEGEEREEIKAWNTLNCASVSGSVTIEKFDRFNNRISGTFEGVVCDEEGNQIVVENGVFNKVPLIDMDDFTNL